jgi:hypothetical protein
MRKCLWLVFALSLISLLSAQADICTAPGHSDCTVTCQDRCIATYWEETGVCQTSCSSEKGMILGLKLLAHSSKETAKIGPDGSKSITGYCNNNGCNNPSTGATKATPVKCTSASGANAGTYTPKCGFYCVPNCGNGDLKQGESGNTSGPGTITLFCAGQAPLQCTLLLVNP